MTIHLPDNLARRLQGIAASRCKSVQQLAVDQLESLAEADDPEISTAAALLKVLRTPPHLSKEDVDALEQAIKSGRIPASEKDLFPE